jgi:hypothetical protein
MKMTTHVARRGAALLLFVRLSFAILSAARNESRAASSPKKRSDIALREAVASNMSALQLRQRARDIALADPLHAVGFFLEVMALDLDEASSLDHRRTLIAEASRRQPSFAAPRIWLTADDIRNERFAEAVNGADAVMRLNGEFRSLLVPILVPLLANDAAYPLLKAKLDKFPIWRTAFVVEAIKTEASAARVEHLLSQSAPSHYQAEMAAERSAYLTALIAKGESGRALALWHRFSPQSKTQPIADGEFTTEFPVVPFAWSFASDEYSYAEKVSASGGSEAIVRAHHSGNGRVALLTQLVALKPGVNRIAITARDGGLAKPDSLAWRVRCLGADDVLAEKTLKGLGGDWQVTTMMVTIADSGCDLQYLSLEADDSDGAESEIEIRKVETR